MTTTDMVNLIRANNQPLSHKVLQAIADRLEEQDAHLRSALATLNTQMQVCYECGTCLQKAWAKPDAKLICGNCDEPMPPKEKN